MVFSLTWLPEILEEAGLKVAETTGWRSRGRADMGTVRGVMCHHTATGQAGNMPTLNALVVGRAKTADADALPGPLAQLGLGRDGTFYVVAAGRANHAGQGTWEGLTTGNSSFIGIEAENNGIDEPWPPVQIDAYQRGVAAILKKIGAGANMCCGHKEYATPKGRKSDPDFDMPSFRKEVASLLAGKRPSPPIPASDDAQRATLRRGATGPLVEQLQGLLNLAASGTFDGTTEAAVRAFQRTAGLVPDGIVGPKTWHALSPAAPPALAAPPEPVAAPAPGFPAAPALPPAAEAPAGPVAAPVPAVAAAPVPPPPTATPAAAVADLVPAPATPAVAPAASTLPAADTGPASFHLDGQTAVGPGGVRFATRTRLGYGTIGQTSLPAWLETLPVPPAVSPSVLRVVTAMSANEGRLEAVNSYDSAHMSFGIFQWTAGATDGTGELALVLATFKGRDRAAFDDCFGAFGLDASVRGAAVTGLLMLNGKVLQTAADKDVLRDIAWAYRFWRAGHHPSLRLAEFDLAAGRIQRFLTVKTLGRPLRDWMNSELAIALVLDEHVNRPGNVPTTLAKAIATLSPGAAPDPTGWTTADEHRLIEAYLDQRRQKTRTSMTDSDNRAAKITDFVRRGLLSDARNSFA